MQAVHMFGQSVDVPAAWVQWVAFLASPECPPGYLADRHASWKRGAIRREDSPVFLEYWQAQERKAAVHLPPV